LREEIIDHWVTKIQLSKNKEDETNNALNEIEHLSSSDKEKKETLEELYRKLLLPPTGNFYCLNNLTISIIYN